MSVRNLVNNALQKGQTQPIEHLYNREQFESIEADTSFVNQGDIEFAKGRSKYWRQPTLMKLNLELKQTQMQELHVLQLKLIID
eukprot:UN05747